MREQTKSQTRKFLLGLIFATALLGLAEVAARLAGISPAYRPDATGSWSVRANLTGHQMQGLREPHDFRITTNQHGLRTAHTVDRSPETFRVAVMGDSTVFGWGVADDESVAAFAEQSLAEAGRTDIEILNAGQPGYSTGMVGWLFEQSVALYKPDLTIVFVSMHDFNRTLISDVERHLGPQTIRARARSVLIRHVSLYEWLRRRLYPLAHEAQVLPDAQTRENRVPRVSRDERRLVLGRMIARAGQWGGRVTVGFLPFHRDLMPRRVRVEDDRPGVAEASLWTEEQGMPLFDLRACCGPGADERTFPFDRGHLNALGNREAGEALAEQLIAHSVPQVQ